MKYLFSFILVSIFSVSQVQAQNYVSFKLTNPTAKSIPLKIPNVMNPNLSPFSTSGVDLKIGQKIYFKYKGKRRLLLEVSKENDNASLNVPKLIRQRKKEIKES